MVHWHCVQRPESTHRHCVQGAPTVELAHPAGPAVGPGQGEIEIVPCTGAWDNDGTILADCCQDALQVGALCMQVVHGGSQPARALHGFIGETATLIGQSYHNATAPGTLHIGRWAGPHLRGTSGEQGGTGASTCTGGHPYHALDGWMDMMVVVVVGQHVMHARCVVGRERLAAAFEEPATQTTQQYTT